MQPRIVGKNAELHPLLVLLALLIGAQFGIGGMIIAVPLAIMARVVLKEMWWDPLERIEFESKKQASAVNLLPGEAKPRLWSKRREQLVPDDELAAEAPDDDPPSKSAEIPQSAIDPHTEIIPVQESASPPPPADEPSVSKKSRNRRRRR